MDFIFQQDLKLKQGCIFSYISLWKTLIVATSPLTNLKHTMAYSNSCRQFDIRLFLYCFLFIWIATLKVSTCMQALRNCPQRGENCNYATSIYPVAFPTFGIICFHAQLTHHRGTQDAGQAWNRKRKQLFNTCNATTIRTRTRASSIRQGVSLQVKRVSCQHNMNAKNILTLCKT